MGDKNREMNIGNKKQNYISFKMSKEKIIFSPNIIDGVAINIYEGTKMFRFRF